jgi:hypothetical protein
MKKVLLVVAAVALLTVSAQAGEIKYHNWPTGGFIPQELVTIPVLMDVGYWIRVVDQDKLQIKLAQEDTHTYSGCTDMVVECNFNCTLTASISKASTSPVAGDFSVTLNGGGSANVDAPGGTVTICAKLANADLKGSTGGAKNVQVATVKVKVVPRT